MPTLDEKRLEAKRILAKRLLGEKLAQSEPAKPAGTTLDTLGDFAQGARQGLLLGFEDELQGGLGAVQDRLLGQDEGRSLVDSYRYNRDVARAAQDKARERSPVASTLGVLGGGMLMPGAAAGKGLAGLAKATGVAAGQAGLSGIGESQADLTKGQIPNLSEVAIPALMAGSLPVVGKTATSAAKFLPKKLEQVAEERAFKAATGQNKKAFKDAYKTGQLTTRGKDLLSEDEAGKPVVGWFSRTEDIAPKAKAKKEFFGKEIGEIGDRIDEIVPDAISGKNISKQIEEYIAAIPATPKNKGIISNLEKEAGYYKDKGKMSFSEAQDLKGSYVFKPTDSTTQVLGQDATNAVRSIVKNEMETAADKISKNKTVPKDTKALIAEYKALKSKYSSYKGAEKTAAERNLGNLSNRFVSPSDYGIGAAGAVIGASQSDDPLSGALKGASLGLGNKLLRERGSAFTARSANLLEDILNKIELEKKLKALGSVNLPLGITEAYSQGK